MTLDIEIVPQAPREENPEAELLAVYVRSCRRVGRGCGLAAPIPALQPYCAYIYVVLVDNRYCTPRAEELAADWNRASQHQGRSGRGTLNDRFAYREALW